MGNINISPEPLLISESDHVNEGPVSRRIGESAIKYVNFRLNRQPPPEDGLGGDYAELSPAIIPPDIGSIALRIPDDGGRRLVSLRQYEPIVA